MVEHIIDTYAWVAYLRGTLKEQAARWIIETGGNQTPTIVLAELKYKYTRERLPGFESDLAFIRTKSSIIPLDEATAIMAGDLRATTGVRGIGLIDCILLAVARRTGLKVLTGDEHFKGLPEAELIKEEVP
jgi:predicted nucleic acid-binding protein